MSESMLRRSSEALIANGGEPLLASSNVSLLTSPRGREMFSYLPGYYETSRIMQADMNAKGAEMDLLFAALDETLQQFFVRTATWGLDRWESELGIATELSKPLDQRRAVVESKLRGSGKFSGRLVKSVAEAYDRGRVEVSFQPGEWRFTVKFVDTVGIPLNLDDLKAAIEELKPAHLAAIYRLSYLTIAEVEAMTIKQMESITQDKLLGGGL